MTSKAVQNILGVDQPDFGQLLSGMVRPDGGELHLGGLIQPKSEVELAFVLSHDLSGPGVTAADVIAATAYVAPCIEIVDSRIRGWDIRIVDTVADNVSCGLFVVGDARAHPIDVDLELAGMVVEVDDEVVTTGAAAAVQGGPANAVARLANTLGRLGLPFRAGEVILSGSQSVLLPCASGTTFACTVGGLGSCSVRFVGSRACVAKRASRRASSASLRASSESHSGTGVRCCQRSALPRDSTPPSSEPHHGRANRGSSS